MIGESYFCLIEFEKANQWYNEMLWPEAFYIKSLILFSLCQDNEAIRYLLTGVTHNWHIAHMIIGIEKPEQIRYVGDSLPDRLSSSEFIHENSHMFKNNTRFKVMLRCLLEDPIIDKLLEELQEVKKRHKEDRKYRPDRIHWDLMYGNMKDDFLALHVPRLLNHLSNKTSNFWLPEENEVITVVVKEKKRINWLVSFIDYPEKKIYFRINSYIEHISEDDLINICVLKSWYYKKSLFISGKVEQ